MPDEWATCLPTTVGLACVAAPLLVGGGGSLHGEDEGRDHYRIGHLVKDLRLHGICLCVAMGKIILRVADERSSCTGREHGTRRLIAHLQEKVNPRPQQLLKSLVSAGKESDLVEHHLSARNLARRKAAAAKRMRRSALEAQMRASNIAEKLGLLVASKRWGDVFAVGGREERAKLKDREEKRSNRLLNTCLPKRVEKVGRRRQRVLGLTLKLVGLSSGSLAKQIAGNETRIDEVKLELVRLRAERAERVRRADEVRLALVRFWCPAALQLLGNNELATRELLSGNEVSTARLNGLGITDEVCICCYAGSGLFVPAYMSILLLLKAHTYI